MKKSTAIKLVAGKHGLGLTNRQIQDLVLSEHRIHCTGQQIIGVVGPYHERVATAGYSRELISRAKAYLATAGDLRTAKNYLDLAEVKR